MGPRCAHRLRMMWTSVGGEDRIEGEAPSPSAGNSCSFNRDAHLAALATSVNNLAIRLGRGWTARRSPGHRPQEAAIPYREL